MTSQGTAYGRFRRSLDRRQPTAALSAAAELPQVSLTDALELLLLLRGYRGRFEAGSVRWHARFALETRGVTLPESQSVLALLGALSGPRAAQACAALAELLDRRGLERAAEALVRESRGTSTA